MSRLSLRRRPLDIHKKLPIVKSIKYFEDEDSLTSSQNSQILYLPAEADNKEEIVETKDRKRRKSLVEDNEQSCRKTSLGVRSRSRIA